MMSGQFYLAMKLVFFNFINSLETSIQFTCETETNKTLAFLDVVVSRKEDGMFSTSVYRKSSHSNRYLNFQSNHPFGHKLSVVRSLMDRAQQLSSSTEEHSSEVKFVKQVLASNNYPLKIFNSIRNNKQQNSVNPTKSVVLPYVQGLSERLARVLRVFNISTFYKPINKISTVLGLPKDPIDSKSICGVVYRINCSDCGEQYIGQTTNSLATRLKQHKAAYEHLQGEKSALAEHAISKGHVIDWAHAKVIHRETRWRQRLFAEAIHTKRLGSIAMNRCEMGLPSVYLSVM